MDNSNCWTQIRVCLDINRLKYLTHNLVLYPCVYKPLFSNTNSQSKKAHVNPCTTGIQVHQIIHNYLLSNPISQNMIPEYKQYFEGFKYYVSPQIDRVYASEFEFIDESNRFHGRFDALISLNGKVSLVDWKTSLCNTFRRPFHVHIMQLVTYYYSLSHSIVRPHFQFPAIEQLVICYLMPDGSVRIVSLPVQSLTNFIEYWLDFLANR